MKSLRIRIPVLLTLAILFLASCEYEKIEFEEVIITEEVSFQDDIIPIFNNGCNTANCHAAGKFIVDLSPEGAYQAIFDKDLINLDIPEESLLYTKLDDPAGSHAGRSLPVENQLILKWIEEGAENN